MFKPLLGIKPFLGSEDVVRFWKEANPVVGGALESVSNQWKGAEAGVSRSVAEYQSRLVASAHGQVGQVCEGLGRSIEGVMKHAPEGMGELAKAQAESVRAFGKVVQESILASARIAPMKAFAFKV